MPPQPFPIVGVGASAGGIEAMEGFFRGLPARPGLAIVVITHLSPERESLLPEVLARYTELPVQVVVDDQQVEPDQVYVLSADAVLGIEGGRLQVTRPNTGRRERKPIDIFFSALAADQGEHAAGVVLSGGDGDGTLGVKAIKERGGLTLAQVADGHGPAHPDMPDSAIASGLIDFALPVEEMGARLVDFARGLHLLDGIAAGAEGDPSAEAAALEGARQEICNILRDQIGHDFAGYKPKTFLRRVQRRMQVRQFTSMEGYLDLLRQNPQEVSALFRDLLISVTNFFRDADAFEALAETVIPRLFEGRAVGDAVRIWVPGCATGEEVYSLAILLREQMDRLATAPRVQIFATDIDERALGVARAARYPESLLEGVSAERRERFFVPDGGSHIVAKEVRDLCVFSPHSVLRDPPFSRIDLVSCRNLLIYFGATAQNQVIPIFHYALRPGGYLFLGTSENISGFGDLFTPLEKKHRIFLRRGDAPQSIRLPMALSTLRPGHVAGTTPPRLAGNGMLLRQAVETQVLERFAPPFVVVNRDGDIAYYSARTGKYLEAAAGTPTRQILTLARRGLRLDLRTTLREAFETGRTVTRDGIAVEEDDGRVQLITLTVEPLRDRDEPLFLVLFADEGPPLGREEALARSQAAQDGAALRLEAELRETRERLQSLIEEYETALEEVKASNEELVSLNEELQSTNEEMEASKEELQSVNEELQTVNLELNSKVEALDRAHDDLKNLFESTDVATIFLDRSLQIRSFTPAATRIFNLLPTDRGRPITDLSSRFTLPELDRNIAAVLESGEPFERQLDHEEARAHYLARLAPYRNGDGRVQGVVLTFLDVTGVTRAEARQRVLIAELQHRTRNLLNVVQAIILQTLGKEGTPKLLVERLGAIGRVQSLISQSRGEEVDLAEVVRLELRAYAAGQDGRVSVSGPSVSLGYERVQILALALHELTTNAVKHGALKEAAGRLQIRWAVERRGDGEAVLVLDWRESGVAMPPDTSRRGYGRELIERALRYTMRAKASLDLGRDGVVCRIEMPLPPRPELPDRLSDAVARPA
ncbi:CheR family methyltransferase [Roseicella frigidaeris]|uniref:histidine kinase n=1 Tax=Roseicella frigidaeris TaxID=2230885 RepID=A0A327M753_9PROT|nr:CheR family methyltransferase [Roseicella frigidaeris]RAI58132.1 chemotaxis protein CheR [Roseicella frigidaeris]